jgi:hypothetical protein
LEPLQDLEHKEEVILHLLEEVLTFHQQEEEEEAQQALFQLNHQVGLKRVGQEDLAEELLQVTHKLGVEPETLEVIVHLKETVADKIIHYNQVELVAEEHHKMVVPDLLYHQQAVKVETARQTVLQDLQLDMLGVVVDSQDLTDNMVDQQELVEAAEEAPAAEEELF